MKVQTQKREKAIRNPINNGDTQLLLYNRGKWQKVISEQDFSNLRESVGINRLYVNQVIFPFPEKPSFLLNVKLEDRSGDNVERSFSDLYWYEDDEMRPISWENSLGFGREQKPLSFADTIKHPLIKGIEFHVYNLPGNLDGLIVEFPFEFREKNTIDAFRQNYRQLFDCNSKERKLIQFPEFENSSGKRITLENVVAWKSENEAVVRIEDGFYIISKQEN